MPVFQFQFTHDSCSNKKISGFTFIELTVTLVIAAILVALAAPSFTAAIQNQRTSSEINNLLNDLQFARSEALKEGQMVGLCVSTNGTSCSGSSWQSGWIVYSAGAVAGFVAGSSIVLRVQPAFTSGDQIATNPANVTSVTFNRDGFSQGFAGTTGLLFTLHNSTASNAATRCIWIDVLGRSYVQKYGTAVSSSNCMLMKPSYKLTQSATQSGISLVEVLIALLVISAGLLGLSKMQALSMANTQLSSSRGLVALQTASLAALLHGNSAAYWQGGAGSTLCTLAAPCTFSGASTSLFGTVPALSSCQSSSSASVCTGTQIAALDINSWMTNMSLQVPGYSTTLSCSSTPTTCLIEITWYEKAAGMNTTTATLASANTSVQQAYYLYVQP